MAGSEPPLVRLRVRSTPADRSATPSRLITLVPVPRTPSETVALPLLTPGDLIRAARARWRQELGAPPTEDGGGTGAPPTVPAPRAPSLPVPDVTRPIARVPFPRAPSGSTTRDPLAAVLTSLSRTAPVPPAPRRGAKAPLVLAVVLAVVGVVLLALAVTGQASVPAARDTGDLAPGPASTATPAAPPAAPTRLVVPAAGVNSAVRQVGLAPDRSMAVPAPGPDYDLAAWYRYSVTPGEQGPSVIIGHVDSRTTGPSVFFGLGRLRPGDRVTIGRADSSVVDFVVYATRTVAKDAFPTDEVYGPTYGAELRLVSCGGSFDTAARSYRDNVVVFARRI